MPTYEFLQCGSAIRPGSVYSIRRFTADSDEAAWEFGRLTFGLPGEGRATADTYEQSVDFTLCVLYRLGEYPKVRLVSGEHFLRADTLDPQPVWIRVAVGYPDYNWSGKKDLPPYLRGPHDTAGAAHAANATNAEP
jgi:hypothetical protein